ncbi:MAG: hypothetical protein M3O93_06515 [Chloroflexota bacterium]|nr:hypothetical protein [Chloroflexota bacterium]
MASSLPAGRDVASGPRREQGAGGGRGFMQTGRAAAGLASERVELWAPGALASLAFAGWLPFVLAIVTLPTVGDLGFLGTSIGISPNFPWNVILLAIAAGLTLVAASVAVATGEAALQRGIDRATGRASSSRSLDDESARLWVVQLVAALPALVVIIATLLVGSSVAQSEYQSPDIGGPFAFRLARDLWPLLAALVACVILGQAFGGSAQRAARGPDARPLSAALAQGLRAVIRHPLRTLLVTLVSDLALVVWLVLSWALLHVLWAPIGRAVGRGALLESGTALLLVGFVAIWLCLVAAGGALHAWSSSWWSLDLDGHAAGEGGG